MTAATPFEVVTDAPRLDPAWDQARLHLAAGRRAARALATEIERLRGVFEHGGARRGSSSQVVNLNAGAGFVAQLEAQLGLHPEQAKRICEAASYQLRIEQVARADVGERVGWTDPKTGPKSIEVTATRKALAQQAVDSWTLPAAPKPSRFWAGICGEGDRVAATGKKERAAVEPGKQIRDAMHSLAKWMKGWEKLPLNQRAILAQTAKKLELEALLAPLWADVADVEDET